jgi:hypothetical protein
MGWPVSLPRAKRRAKRAAAERPASVSANFARSHRAVLTRQSRLQGGRVPATGGLHPLLDAKIADAMAEMQVTRPFVLTVALADFFGVDYEEVV